MLDILLITFEAFQPLLLHISTRLSNLHIIINNQEKYSIYNRACVAKRRVSARAVGESLTRVRVEAVGRDSNDSLASHSEDYKIYFIINHTADIMQDTGIILQYSTTLLQL